MALNVTEDVRNSVHFDIELHRVPDHVSKFAGSDVR